MADVDRWAQSASILHSNGDAMDIAVKDDRIVGVRGRAVDRVNRGRLGPKDLYGWPANHSPDRLTRPLIRRNGRLVETDWETAMTAVAGASLDWEVLAQTAQALEEAELLALCQRHHPQTLRQLRWANAKVKETAAQVMVTS